MSTTQHEAIELASDIDEKRIFSCSQTAAMLRQQHALLAEVVRVFGDSVFEHDDERQAIAAAKDYLK